MPIPPEVTAASYFFAAGGVVILAFVLGIALGHGPIAGFTFYLLLIAAAALIVVGLVKRDRERRRLALKWARMSKIWQNLYYCRSDGIIVSPADPSTYIHRDDMVPFLLKF